MIPIAALALSLTPMPVAEEHGIPYTKFVLDNGLQVLVHEDHMNPVVTVCVVYHVGSANEERGKTGLAHLFEHMMFEGSEHVHKGEHERLITEAGGNCDGMTSRDSTIYYEVLPANELALALWLESDRMGFLLPGFDQQRLDRVVDVVRNERREGIDAPLGGSLGEKVLKLLYPADHPYSSSSIGSHEDLAALTLDDVKTFGNRWYAPNNATLAIGGDVDVQRVRALVQAYFAPIPSHSIPDQDRSAPFQLERDARYVDPEDNARTPMLVLVWPVPPIDGTEAVALKVLSNLVDDSFGRALRSGDSGAREAQASFGMYALGGEFMLSVKADPNQSLEAIEADTYQRLESIESSITPETVARYKKRWRILTLGALDGVAERTLSLGRSNAKCARPNDADDQLHWAEGLDVETMLSVFRTYVIHRPHMVLSVVPKAQGNLASNLHDPWSTSAVVKGVPPLDRVQRPEPEGSQPKVVEPVVWRKSADNGLKLIGITRPNSPTSLITLTLPLGPAFESGLTAAAASTVTAISYSRMFGAGSQEWVNRARDLGCTGTFSMNLNCSETLLFPSENIARVGTLLRDMTEEPVIEDADLDTCRKFVRGKLGENSRTEDGSTPMLSRLLYGQDSILASDPRQRSEAVLAVTKSDVETCWKSHLIPSGSILAYVGPLDAKGLTDALAPLTTDWKASSAATKANYPALLPASPTSIHLCDYRGAVQSEIEIAQPTMNADGSDYLALWTALKLLKDGGAESPLNHRLRGELGYTYHCDATLGSGRSDPGLALHLMVNTPQTAPALKEIIAILRGFADSITQDQLDAARRSIRRKAARGYETNVQCLEHLLSIQYSKQPDDEFDNWMGKVDALTLADVRGALARHIDTDHLVIVVTGDASTIRADLGDIGLGAVIDIDWYGNVIEKPKADK